MSRDREAWVRATTRVESKRRQGMPRRLRAMKAVVASRTRPQGGGSHSRGSSSSSSTSGSRAMLYTQTVTTDTPHAHHSHPAGPVAVVVGAEVGEGANNPADHAGRAPSDTNLQGNGVKRALCQRAPESVDHSDSEHSQLAQHAQHKTCKAHTHTHIAHTHTHKVRACLAPGGGPQAQPQQVQAEHAGLQHHHLREHHARACVRVCAQLPACVHMSRDGGGSRTSTPRRSGRV